MGSGKKMGRPKLDNPKTKQIPVRFTDSDYQRMKKQAEILHTTVTQLVRKSVEFYLDSLS